MYKLKLFILAIILISIQGCVTYKAVGRFEQYNEVLTGNVNANLISGGGSFKLFGENTGVECSGEAWVTNMALTCSGQRGEIHADCTDGRVLNGTYRPTSCTAGYGEGEDNFGSKFSFNFGLSEKEALSKVRFELANAAGRPSLPTSQMYNSTSQVQLKNIELKNKIKYKNDLLSKQERLQAENEQLERELKELGVTNIDANRFNLKYKWNFPAINNLNTKTVVVIIGNRNYGKGVPSVTYALNDSRAFRKFVEATLSIPVEQIIYEENASRGKMDGIFKRILPARLKALDADKVIIYFSGHGMVVNNGDAILLPSDADPTTADLIGYPRDELFNQLASLKVKSSTVYLDACYTGTDKGGNALLQGKPVFRSPNQIVVPKNITYISASSGNQIAWMDKNKGHSLMTFYLLKGLSGSADLNNDSKVDSKELENYLISEVNRSALLLFNTEQNPQVIGNLKILSKYK